MKKKSKNKNNKRTVVFENTNTENWLRHEQPLLCEAVRMEPDMDPWARKGKIVRAECSTELRRKKLQELSLNVDHFIADENGAALA